jgi:hypothetical protein
MQDKEISSIWKGLKSTTSNRSRYTMSSSNRTRSRSGSLASESVEMAVEDDGDDEGVSMGSNMKSNQMKSVSDDQMMLDSELMPPPDSSVASHPKGGRSVVSSSTRGVVPGAESYLFSGSFNPL